jgi:GcrA cell cycle regulator
MSYWSPIDDDKLRALHARTPAPSCKEMGKEIGRSKNSIIGRRDRLGLSKSHPLKNVSKRPRKGRVLKLHKPPMARAPLPPPEPVIVDDLRIPRAQRLTLVDLKNHHCRFPVGEPGAPDFFFCGAPTADLAGGRPYCAAHTRRACGPRTASPVSERAQARMSRLGHWAVRRRDER